MYTLTHFGWTAANQLEWDALKLDGFEPARVVADFGTSLKIATPDIITAELSGKLAHYSPLSEIPKVGDWVAARISDNGAVIESVVLRSNEIARKIAGKRVLKQIFAANVDVAFVLLALDNDFSIERLERFLFQLSIDKIKAVIILNKADKTEDLQSYIDQLKQFDLPIIVSTATDASEAKEITAYIKPGHTAILLGSSGVGKSTLTNKLLGRVAQSTNSVRASDSTGKHTTVHRELFILPDGGILIDTPGIRELQLWGTEDELDASFDDIALLAQKCKYTDCQHDKEKGCAVHKALANGLLDKARYSNYLKMSSEISQLNSRATERSRNKSDRTRRAKNKTSRTREDHSSYDVDEW